MKNTFKKNKFSFKDKEKGMTLIELLVVISIITILTGIILFDYSSFRSAISTENLANDIALSVRKAQSNAIGVRGVGDIFSYSHGVNFSTKSPKSFTIFIDKNSDKKYDSSDKECGDGNECKEVLTIKGADKIEGFYLNSDKGSENLKTGTLNILFSRPNPDAGFCYQSSAGANCEAGISSVKVVVSNGQTDNKKVERFVVVWNTGQIGVTKE